MKRAKRLMRSPFVAFSLSYVAAFYIRFVLLTGRMTREVAADSRAIVAGEQQSVVAFWHARMLLLPALIPKGRSMDVLISHHRDGRLISEVIRRFSIGTINGSSSRGAISAVRGVGEKLSLGGNIAITPDGPRGPARRAAAGIAHIARKAALPVTPVAIMAQRHRRLASWDRFVLPLPFSRLALVVASPVVPLLEESGESYAERIERALNAATDRADHLLGFPPEPLSEKRRR